MAITALVIPCAVSAQCIKSGKDSDHCGLRNPAVSANWNQPSGRIGSLTIEDRHSHQQLTLGTPFKVLLADGAIYSASDFTLQAPPHMRALTADPAASRMSDRLNGDAIDTQLATHDGRLKVLWSVILREGSNYVREEVTLTAVKDDVAIRRVEMIDSTLPTAKVSGSVKGSPIVAETFFLGMEHPLSDSKVTAGHAIAFLDRKLPLRAGQSVTYSAVIGTTHAGQLRRDFLTYVERERAHPYRTFLHYNTWYDLGFFNTYDEAGALDRVNAFGRELHDKRGVTLDSFLFDDGWDDHKSLWKFHEGFPQGFTNIRNAAAQYGTAPGVWMSPWGGYGNPKKERVEAGRQQGFEIVNNGFALSGPTYFERFEQVCMDMVRNYGVNQFKFDGTGNANSVFKGSAFDSDFDAAIHLIGDLRHERPGLFVNLTTGTYPSPFWLMVADSIWRGGEDDDVAGVGPYRERWITYRDADTYEEVVQNGPLFPLNSLMLHGLIYASRHKQLSADPTGAFRHEIRSYFGTGTQTQEMYITPSLLTEANWDDLAEAAKWSRSNASVLKDTHWVGGDPAWLQVYGWAAWSSARSILTLRNPSDKPQTIALDMAAVLELPTGAAHTFTARSPWQSDAAQAAIRLQAGKQHLFQLAPFEVLTLELQPAN